MEILLTRHSHLWELFAEEAAQFLLELRILIG